MRARKGSAIKAATRTRTKAATRPRRSAPKVKRRAEAAAPAEVGAGQSVIKQKYRQRYEDGSCGDALARKLRKHLKTDDGTIDLAKLQQLAERNGVWTLRYASLNAGLARMVVANRLRRLVRAGSTIDWG
jgi:hypothetical protein